MALLVRLERLQPREMARMLSNETDRPSLQPQPGEKGSARYGSVEKTVFTLAMTTMHQTVANTHH